VVFSKTTLTPAHGIQPLWAVFFYCSGFAVVGGILPPMPQREPPIDKATLATLRKQGWPVREIASTYHCSTSYITNLVKRYKLPLKSPGEGRRGGNMGHIEISKRELKEMRDDGLTLGEIAEVFGCGVNLISVSNAFWSVDHRTSRKSIPGVDRLALGSNR